MIRSMTAGRKVRLLWPPTRRAEARSGSTISRATSKSGSGIGTGIAIRKVRTEKGKRHEKSEGDLRGCSGEVGGNRDRRPHEPPRAVGGRTRSAERTWGFAAPRTTDLRLWRGNVKKGTISASTATWRRLRNSSRGTDRQPRETRCGVRTWASKRRKPAS